MGGGGGRQGVRDGGKEGGVEAQGVSEEVGCEGGVGMGGREYSRVVWRE